MYTHIWRAVYSRNENISCRLDIAQLRNDSSIPYIWYCTNVPRFFWWASRVIYNKPGSWNSTASKIGNNTRSNVEAHAAGSSTNWLEKGCADMAYESQSASVLQASENMLQPTHCQHWFILPPPTSSHRSLQLNHHCSLTPHQPSLLPLHPPNTLLTQLNIKLPEQPSENNSNLMFRKTTQIIDIRSPIEKPDWPVMNLLFTNTISRSIAKRLKYLSLLTRKFRACNPSFRHEFLWAMEV